MGKKAQNVHLQWGVLFCLGLLAGEENASSQSKEHEGHCGTKPSCIHLDQVNFNYLQIPEQDAH